MEPASAELVARHAAGDASAVREIYDRYALRLLAVARRMLADKLAARVDPEDVVQSAYRSFFLRAKGGQYELRHSGDLWRLLIAITRHKLLHAVEKQTAGKRSPKREVPASEFLAPEPSPADLAAVADELQAIMRELPPLERELLERRLREEPLEAIAAALQKSPRTVRRMLLELRRKFERRLQPDVSDIVSQKLIPEIDGVATLDYRDFVLEQLVGAGGFGKVYRAHWRSHDKTVAVKVLRKRFLLDRRAVQQFVREAELIAQLKHRGVIGVHGLGRTPAGGYFLVLDWHERGDLTRAGEHSLQQAADWVSQAAAAVALAHERGIVHCDLKPSNLLLTFDGRIVVTDFGFAVALHHGDAATPETIGGTHGYIAPELIAGDAPAPACDVYSLGQILQRCSRRRQRPSF